MAVALILLLTGMQQTSAQKPAEPITVKVAVVMQDPRIPEMGNKRMHEVYKTPGYNFSWNDPWKLAAQYRDSLNASSHGAVHYEIVKIYDENIFFTHLKNEKELMTLDRVKELLSEPGWATLKKEGTAFDYQAFIDHYGFGAMRDRKEINEVWLWTFPYGGTYESTFAGANAFWLNSDPVKSATNKELLIIMGLNYEREMSMALESYGHRIESVMRKVYGRWDNKASDPNNWELYTTIDKVNPGKAEVGNIHYPPNGRSDYDWKNSSPVPTFADVWFDYPAISIVGKTPRMVDCQEWHCSHGGYMSWWYRHLPHFKGLNPADGHLNNWWYYAVDYNAAMKEEGRLRAAADRAKKTPRRAEEPPVREREISLSAGLVIRQSARVKKAVYRLPVSDSLSQAPITIEGDNITVDFNGAVINGIADPESPDMFKGTGILIKGGKNITLTNLTVKGFKVGLMARGVKGLRITNGDFSYNFRQHLNSNREREDLADWQSYHHNEQDEWLRFGAGIYLRNCDSFDIHASTVTNGQCGLMMTYCHQGLIYNNNFSYNSGVGIGLYHSSRNRILYNRVDWNVRGYSFGVYYRGQDSGGILVFEQSSNNEIACNSVTHSGDGLFLWAGETTLQTGKGGCNDNLVYANDFSYAPTNAIEITFSRNRIIGNILHDSWHGIWGGFSYNTVIARNDFGGNLSAIAIEHGNNNVIDQNTFHRDGMGIEIWSDPNRKKEGGFMQNRDTRSRQYTIRNNTFIEEKKPFSINHTGEVNIRNNRITGLKSAPKFDSTVKDLVYTANGETVDPMTDSSYLPVLAGLPDGVNKNDVLLPSAHPKGKKYIMMTPWGPCNFGYPILWWSKTDSAGKMSFDLIGPPGKWKILRMKGLSHPSANEGVFPGELTVQSEGATGSPAPSDFARLKDIDIELEYRGEEVISPLGKKIPPGRPYRFHYRELQAPLFWQMKWFSFDSTNDPVKNGPAFEKMINGAPLKKTEGKDLSDVFGNGFGKQIATEKIATVSTTGIDVPAGTYRIGISASEIVKLYIDDKLVIDSWDPSAIIYDADYHRDAVVALEGRHTVKVEQAQYGGYGMLFFTIQPVRN